jgi:hypothetical protein
MSSSPNLSSFNHTIKFIYRDMGANRGADEVSAAIPGGAAAWNAPHNRLAMERSGIVSPS